MHQEAHFSVVYILSSILLMFFFQYAHIQQTLNAFMRLLYIFAIYKTKKSLNSTHFCG